MVFVKFPNSTSDFLAHLGVFLWYSLDPFNPPLIDMMTVMFDLLAGLNHALWHPRANDAKWSRP